jgi:acyl-CoA thioester hydrolase
MTEKVHHHSCRVYAYDTDYGGIVHHANYLRFLEQGRTKWCEDSGYSLIDLYENKGLFFVVRDLSAHYKVAATLHQHLVVLTKVCQHRKTVLQFEQSIHDEHNMEHVFFSATLQLVCVDKSLRPRAVPKEIMENIL